MTLSKGYLKQIFPSDKGLFAAQIIFKRKVKMYKDFRARMMPKKVCVLNTEELATVYHMPDIFVQAPALPRVPAKKGQPPGLLPT